MGKYDLDFHAWALEQADVIRRRSNNEIDWENVAEEIESLGKQQAAELRNRYIVLLTHLLKWVVQPERRGQSWRLSILEQRDRLQGHLGENLSLKSLEDDQFARAYRTARLKAARETRKSIDIIPIEPPFTPEQAKSDDFWPE